MPSREPGREEYEGRVLAWLRKRFLEEDYPVYCGRGRISFENVRLENAGSKKSSVIVTFRDPGRPGCLFGRREDAVGAPGEWQDPSDAPELWAQMIWIWLEEDIQTSPGLLKGCDPGAVTWI